ncbi:WXG100 family type VII secretion target [Clostridium sp.]|uniref:WXG100 family type VII secretion target n=1 Tax=Clostridium sp. TaxID=1506 RepID=UPI002629DEF8|nr:WXG100 family type VII secretion target [uncultured Clostridium sp.]
MAKLTIDLNQLEQTILDYNKSFEEFKKMKKNLDSIMENLRGSGWVSGASTKYFKKYNDDWSTNMEMHMRIFANLQECLTEAKTNYYDLYQDIPNLGSDL